MGSYSIEVDRLALGCNQFEQKWIAPAHKKFIESSLSNYYLNQKNVQISQDQKIPFRFDIASSSLVINGEKIALKGPDLKEAKRIAEYYQNLGLLPAKGIAPADVSLRERAAKAAVRAMHYAKIPGTNGQVLAGARIAEDTLSTTRHVLYSIPAIGPNNPVVNHLGYYAGILWAYFSFQEVSEGAQDLERAKEIGDREGKTRAQARLASGGIVLSASTLYLSGRVFDSMASASAATAVFGAANALFGVGTVLAAAISYLGWTRCHTFNERLNEYLENKELSEVQRLQGALRFLKAKISVTSEEIEELRNKIETENPQLNRAEKEARLRKEVSHLAEAKVKYLKRRTSNKSLQLILSQLDPILAKLDDEKTRSQGIKEGTLLIQKIQNENRIKMALFILGFIAGLISIAGLLVTTFASAGLVLPFVLYGVAGAIHLGMRVYTSAGLFAKKDPKAAVPSNQDAVPLEFHQAIV